MKTYSALLASNTTLASVVALCLATFIVGCNKPAESGPPPQTTSVGTEIDDSVVTTRVKSALLADPDIKGFDFKVETRKGEVQLSGFVDNQTQVDRATDVIRGVEGVKKVENNVSLKGGPSSIGVKIDDSVITTQVKTALLADESIKSFDIAVVTRKGEVQLSGFVDNQIQMDRAIEVVHGIEGVRSVSNQMSVKK